MKFDLSNSLSDWRKKILKSGAFEEGDLAELEDHLLTGIEQLTEEGWSEEEAFEIIIDEQYAHLGRLTEQYHAKRATQNTSISLISNYFKVGIRSFTRHKMYFTINLIGLVIGLSSVLSISAYLNHELNFDRFNDKSDQIHRISIHYERPTGSIHYPLIPPAAGPAFFEHLPEVENYARLRYSYSVQMHRDDQSFYEDRVFFADPSFLEMFSYKWLQGGQKDALAEVNTIVLTKSMAKKYFGEQDPIGQTITYNNEINLEVVGIIEDAPVQSHLKFDFLISFDTFKPGPGSLEPLTSWRWLGFVTYLQLTPGSDLETISGKLYDVSAELNDRPPGGTRIAYELQPLNDIYLHSSHLSNPQGGLFRVNEFENIRNLGIVAALILLVAFFNFYNISTALMRTRTREMGVRKVFGASKKRMMFQMATEALILVSSATALSWMLLFISSGYTDLIPSLTAEATYSLIAISMAIIAAFSVLSGLFLGGTLSSYSVLSLLQQKIWMPKRKFNFGSLILLIQFGISASMIMISIIVMKQLSFFSDKELGYNHEGVLVAKYRGLEMHQKRDAFVNNMLQLPDVTAVSFGPNLDGSNSSSPLRLKEWGEDELVQTAYFGVDYYFDKIIDLNVLEGRYFSRAIAGDSTHAIMINETLKKQLGFENPIGKKVIFTANEEFEIIGVFKDFHYKSLHHEIGPMALKIWIGEPRNVLIRYDSPEIANTLSGIETSWAKMFSGSSIPLDYRFLDEQLQSMYGNEQTYAELLRIFTALAIFIAILGLFGLSSVNIDLNLKQIGIRRVLGADLKQIASVVSRKFLMIVLLSTVIAVPGVYYLMSKWLSNFAYAITLSFDFPAYALLLMLMVSIGTLAYQVFRVMVVNPSSILRDD